MRVYNEALPISNSGDMSQATLTSDPIYLEHQFGFALQAVYTGTPTGTLKLQASCDEGTNDNGAGVTNWTDISGATAALAGAAGNSFFNISDVHYKWARLVYTRTGGVGTLTAQVNSKGA